MKKRFRYYVRCGWEIVEVDRANLYEWDNSDRVMFGNDQHYKEIRTWCNDTFPKGQWEGSMEPSGRKRFAFQQPKHATLFRLKYGS